MAKVRRLVSEVRETIAIGLNLHLQQTINSTRNTHTHNFFLDVKKQLFSCMNVTVKAAELKPLLLSYT